MPYSKEITDEIKKYLDDVSHHMSNVDSKEKSDILQNLESHIYDALKASEKPTLETLKILLSEMDSPSSYVNEEDPTEKTPATYPKMKKRGCYTVLVGFLFFFIALSWQIYSWNQVAESENPSLNDLMSSIEYLNLVFFLAQILMLAGIILALVDWLNTFKRQ